MSIEKEDKSFVTPVLTNYTRYIAAHNQNKFYSEVYIQEVNNTKTLLGFLLGVLPYLIYAYICLKFYPEFVSSLVDFASSEQGSLFNVTVVSSIFVGFNFLIYKLVHKKLYNKIKKNCFPGFESMIKKAYFKKLEKQALKEKESAVMDTVNLFRQSPETQELREATLKKLGILADEKGIPEESLFYDNIVRKLSELEVINVSIFEYSDKVIK